MISTIKNSFLILLFVTLTLVGQNNFNFKNSFNDLKHFEERELNISIYENGIELYKIKKLLLANFSIPEVVLFENGNFALIHSLEGLLEFYSTGALQTKKILLDNNFYNESSILFSVDNVKIALLITEEQKNKIVLLDDLGNQIFEKEVQDGLGSGIAYSEDADILAVSINNWKKNKLVSNSIFTNIEEGHEFTVPHKFEKGFFGKISSTFLGHSNNKLFLVDLNSNQLLWSKEAKSNSIFIQSKIKDNNVIVLEAPKPEIVNNSWKYQNCEVITFGSSGVKLKSQAINKPFESIDIIEENDVLYFNANGEKTKIN
ncbi:MAG: hypothetical protein GY936_07115 [Ignavibacteriae bacterium]|nr:hypothetical protein [Ignavibacteriota bacterium]